MPSARSKASLHRAFVWLAFPLLLATWAAPALAQGDRPEPAASRLPSERTGLLDDRDTFPIAVWLQSPANAAKYRKAGINLYVGLWKGPTDEQLAELKAQGMRVI